MVCRQRREDADIGHPSFPIHLEHHDEERLERRGTDGCLEKSRRDVERSMGVFVNKDMTCSPQTGSDLRIAA